MITEENFEFEIVEIFLFEMLKITSELLDVVDKFMEKKIESNDIIFVSCYNDYYNKF